MYNHNIHFHWFRRDLRLKDHAGLKSCLADQGHCYGLFIFDHHILKQLENKADPRVQFIYQQVRDLQDRFRRQHSDFFIFYGEPQKIYYQIVRQIGRDHQLRITCVEDYEPYARKRDQQISQILSEQGKRFVQVKDQCLFAKDEILTDAGKPYTVYTPYKNKVLKNLSPQVLLSHDSEALFQKMRSQPMTNELQKRMAAIPGYFHDKMTLADLGFQPSSIMIPSPQSNIETLKNYTEQRDYPAIEQGTSRLGIHFRFGTVSVREYAQLAMQMNQTWLSELIWRDFFMQILWHYPHVMKQSFRQEFDQLDWRFEKSEFERWQNGMTGYPLVDAGMRELRATGHMHNRVRMVVASFLTKHLFMHWSWGERYFAQYLLDYDMAANNGNWQWAAGTGCDAAPYFRIFNPTAQAEKFDKDQIYIKKWIPELNTLKYPRPMIDHAEARSRALHGFSKIKK